MNVSIYLLLGSLDIFSIILFTFCFFSLPFKEYLKEVMIISVSLSLSSYFVRIVFGAPLFDTLIQVILLILLIRFLVKVRTTLSILITVIGTMAYIFLQPLVIFLFDLTGIIPATASSSAETWGARAIQLSTDILMIAASLILIRFGLGITYFARPPHSMYLKERLSKNFFLILLIACIGVAITCLLMFLLLQIKFLLIPPIAFSVLLVLVILVLRRDYYSHVLGIREENC